MNDLDNTKKVIQIPFFFNRSCSASEEGGILGFCLRKKSVLGFKQSREILEDRVVAGSLETFAITQKRVI